MASQDDQDDACTCDKPPADDPMVNPRHVVIARASQATSACLAMIPSQQHESTKGGTSDLAAHISGLAQQSDTSTRTTTGAAEAAAAAQQSKQQGLAPAGGPGAGEADLPVQPASLLAAAAVCPPLISCVPPAHVQRQQRSSAFVPKADIPSAAPPFHGASPLLTLPTALPQPQQQQAAAGHIKRQATAQIMARRGPCITCGSTAHNWGYTTPDGRYTCHMCCFSNRQATGFYGPVGSHSREDADGGFSRSCAECGANRTHSWRGHKQHPGLLVCNACHMRYKRTGNYRRRVTRDVVPDYSGGVADKTGGGSSATPRECVVESAAAVDTAKAATTTTHLAAACDVDTASANVSTVLPGVPITPAGHTAAAPSAPNGRAAPTCGEAATVHGVAEYTHRNTNSTIEFDIEDSGAKFKTKENSRERVRSNLGARDGPCDACGLAQSLRWYQHKMHPTEITCQACYDRYRRRGTYGQQRAPLHKALVPSSERQQVGETASVLPTGRCCGGSGKDAARRGHRSPSPLDAVTALRPAVKDGVFSRDTKAGTVAEPPQPLPAPPLPPPPLLDLPRLAPVTKLKGSGPALCRKRQRKESTGCCSVCGEARVVPLAASTSNGSDDDDRCSGDTSNIPLHNANDSVSDGDDDYGWNGSGEAGRRRGRYRTKRYSFVCIACITRSSPPLAGTTEAPPEAYSSVVPAHPARAMLQDGLDVHRSNGIPASIGRQGLNARAAAAAATKAGPREMSFCLEAARTPFPPLAAPMEMETVTTTHKDGEAAAAAATVSDKRARGITVEPMVVVSQGKCNRTSEEQSPAGQAGGTRSAADAAACTTAFGSGGDGTAKPCCAECGSETTSHNCYTHKTRLGLVMCRSCCDGYRTGGSHKQPPHASISTESAGAAGNQDVMVLKRTLSAATFANEINLSCARERGNAGEEDTRGDPCIGNGGVMANRGTDTAKDLVNGHSQPIQPRDLMRLRLPADAGTNGANPRTTCTSTIPAFEQKTLKSVSAAETSKDRENVESNRGGVRGVSVVIAHHHTRSRCCMKQLQLGVSHERGSGAGGSSHEAAGAGVGPAAAAHVAAMDTCVCCEVCGSTHTAKTMLPLCDGRCNGRRLPRLLPPLVKMPRELWVCRECCAVLGRGPEPSPRSVRQQRLWWPWEDEGNGKERAGLGRPGGPPLQPLSSPAAARISAVVWQPALESKAHEGKKRLVWRRRAERGDAELDAQAEGGGEDGEDSVEEEDGEEGGKDMKKEEELMMETNELRGIHDEDWTVPKELPAYENVDPDLNPDPDTMMLAWGVAGMEQIPKVNEQSEATENMRFGALNIAGEVTELACEATVQIEERKSSLQGGSCGSGKDESANLDPLSPRGRAVASRLRLPPAAHPVPHRQTSISEDLAGAPCPHSHRRPLKHLYGASVTAPLQPPGRGSPLRHHHHQHHHQEPAASPLVLMHQSLPIGNGGDEQQQDEQSHQAGQQQVRPQAPCGSPAGDLVPPAVTTRRPGSLGDGAELRPDSRPDPHCVSANPDVAILARLTQHFAATLAASCEALVEMEDLYGIHLLESSRTLQPTNVESAGGDGGETAGWPSPPSPPEPSPLRQAYDELCGSDRKLRAKMLGDLALRWLEDTVWRRLLELMLGRGVRDLGLDRVGPVEGLDEQQQADWDSSRRAVYSNFATVAQAAIEAAAGRDDGTGGTGGTAPTPLPRTTATSRNGSTSSGAHPSVSFSAIQHFLAVADQLAEGLAGHLLGWDQTPSAPPGPSRESKTQTKPSPLPSLALPPVAAVPNQLQPVKPGPLRSPALVQPVHTVWSLPPTLLTQPPPMWPFPTLAPRQQPTTGMPTQLQPELPLPCKLRNYPASVIPSAGARHSSTLGAHLIPMETVPQASGTTATIAASVTAAAVTAACAMKIINEDPHTTFVVDVTGHDSGGGSYGGDGMRGMNEPTPLAIATDLLRGAVHIAVHLAFQVGASSNGRLMLRLVSPGDPLPPPSLPPPPPQPLQAAGPEEHAEDHAPRLLALSDAPAVPKAVMAVAVEWLWSETCSVTDDNDNGCRPRRPAAKYPGRSTGTHPAARRHGVNDNSGGSENPAVGAACMPSKRQSRPCCDNAGGMGWLDLSGSALQNPGVGEQQIRPMENQCTDSHVERNDGGLFPPVTVWPIDMTSPPSLGILSHGLHRDNPALDELIMESAAFGGGPIPAVSGVSVLPADFQKCVHHRTECSMQLLTKVARLTAPPTALPSYPPQLLLATPVQSLPPSTPGEIILPTVRPSHPRRLSHPLSLQNPSGSNACSIGHGGNDSSERGGRHHGDGSKRGAGDGRGAGNSRDALAAVLWVVSPAVVSREAHWEKGPEGDAAICKSCQRQTSATGAVAIAAAGAVATAHAVGGGVGCRADGDEGAGPPWRGRRVVVEVPIVPAHVVGCGALHRP